MSQKPTPKLETSGEESCRDNLSPLKTISYALS